MNILFSIELLLLEMIRLHHHQGETTTLLSLENWFRIRLASTLARCRSFFFLLDSGIL